MIVHELATNAAKYGALSSPEGQVRVAWRRAMKDGVERVEFDWRESGGPPVASPIHRGFGTRLIERSVRNQLGGSVAVDYSESGLGCRISFPLAEAEASARPPAEREDMADAS